MFVRAALVTFVGMTAVTASAQDPGAAAPAAPSPALPPPAAAARLEVLVVGHVADGATQAWVRLVKTAGMVARVVERAECAPERLRTADVVLVDWPRSQPLPATGPLGPFERWDRPTVFVGDAGASFAAQWGLPTAEQMAAMAPAARGPEMQQLAAPAGTPAVWRQGHLFHVPVAIPRDGEPDRAWLLQTIRLAARFVTDRPILRHGAPPGAEPPAAERERRQRVASACEQLGIAANGLADLAVLRALPQRLDGEHARTVATLLADLIADGPDAETSRNNWLNWLRPRADSLVWDPLSSAWRLDWLAHWRGVASASCRGDQRADGALREPEAEALAAKVVQHHGGRALADLEVFSCWRGSVHHLWDRRRGYLRVENHHVLPAGALATGWKVSVIDTAADREVIWGGGPPPRPRVSARGMWRDLVEEVFLPVVLLDPGVSLRRAPEHDADGKLALAVRLAGRGMNPRAEHVLLVGPDGAIARIVMIDDGRERRTVRVATTVACGPLLLPAELVHENVRTPRAETLVEPRWNPPSPPDLATATGQLTEPRDK